MVMPVRLVQYSKALSLILVSRILPERSRLTYLPSNIELPEPNRLSTFSLTVYAVAGVLAGCFNNHVCISEMLVKIMPGLETVTVQVAVLPPSTVVTVITA
jgi:hypothetical protein